jgi:hypothetical protein
VAGSEVAARVQQQLPTKKMSGWVISQAKRRNIGSFSSK